MQCARFILLPLAFLVVSCGEETNTPYEIPLLQMTTPTSATLVWETERKEPACLTLELEGQPATRETTCYPSDTLHELVLTGLQPATHYRYEIAGVKPDKTEENPLPVTSHTFRTPDEATKPFAFGVMGDSHGKVDVLVQLLTAATLPGPRRMPIDFLLHVGDAVEDGGHATYFTDLIEPGRAVFDGLPLYAAMGNHEEDSDWFYHYHAYPGREDYYAFTHGNTFFVVLNTNKDYTSSSKQYHWLVQRLASPEAARATWRVVSFHHPPYGQGWGPCGDFTGDADAQEYLVPLFERQRVDLVFNGHVHGYERGSRQGVTYVTTGGGGGGLDHHCQSWDHIAVAKYAHHHVRVEIDGERLWLRAVGLDGQLLDQLQLRAH